MSMDIKSISFENLEDADLIVDCVYEGGTNKNMSDEVLHRLLPKCGTSSGFRKVSRNYDHKKMAYVVLYTSMSELEWPDYLDKETGIFRYYSYDKPARTMLTSEGSFSRTTHIVKDKKTGRIRLLTPIEMERIQGFPTNWTKDCLVDGQIVEMPVKKRRFMMGNALVVNLIKHMEPVLSKIFDEEPKSFNTKYKPNLDVCMHVAEKD